MLKTMRDDKKEDCPFINIVTFYINIIYLVICASMFVVGVLWLTTYFYQYTFSAFNPTLISAFFVSFGVTIAFLAFINLFRLKLKKYIKCGFPLCTIATSSFFILVLFSVLFAIGIWGLNSYTNDKLLKKEVKSNIQYSVRHANLMGHLNKQNKEIDWLQKSYSCCGINSYLDWNKRYHSYELTQSKNQTCFVPDSCCNFKVCTKYFFKGCKILNNLINKKGCLNEFMKQLYRDNVFLALFDVILSLSAIILWVINLILYFFLKVKK